MRRLERLHGGPGVQSAGFTTYLPLGGSDNGWAFFIEGRPPLLFMAVVAGGTSARSLSILRKK